MSTGGAAGGAAAMGAAGAGTGGVFDPSEGGATPIMVPLSLGFGAT
jgi:hypothetical protein